MSMSKKDYELIASVFENELYGWKLNDDGTDQSEYIAVVDTAIAMAQTLELNNTKFDRTRFLQACGIGE